MVLYHLFFLVVAKWSQFHFHVSRDRVNSPKGGFPGPLFPDLQPGRDRRRINARHFLQLCEISLKDNPSHLYKIFKSIEQNIEVDLENIDDAIGVICELSQLTNRNSPIDSIEFIFVTELFLSTAKLREVYIATFLVIARSEVAWQSLMIT